MGFDFLDPDDWRDLGETVGDGFNSAVDWIASTGSVVVGTLADGAVKIYKSSAGVVSYAADLTRTSTSSIQSWSAEAAGDVGEFTVGAYQQSKAWAHKVWEKLGALAPMSPPALGPEDPQAREALVALLGLGLDDGVVRAWERDARRKGYTMAIDLRGKFAVPGIQAGAFGGVYVDKQGKWGFLAGTGISTHVSPTISAQALVDVYMIFGSREAYSQKYLMPGLTLTIPTPTGAAVAAGGNALIASDLSFKGFRLLCGLELITPDRPVVVPDMGPPQSNILGATLSVKAPALDAACRAEKAPGQEPAILSTAAAASLPFLRDPSRSYKLLAHHSKKCLEIAGGALVDKTSVVQRSYQGLPHQQFRFEPSADKDGSYVIRPVHALNAGANKVFDIVGRSKKPEARLEIYQRMSTNNDNQEFRFTTNNDGSFCIIAKHSGLALDVQGASNSDGAQLQQFGWHGKPNQRFWAASV